MSKKSSKKKTKKQIFVVETVNTFYEVHLVEASSEAEAKVIVEHSDYNASKWLGQQIANVSVFKEEDMPRLKQLDSYFFEGYATTTEDGDLIYKKPDGSVNGGMHTTNISGYLKNIQAEV